MNILIIGGNGGIGLAVVKQCLKQYPSAQVYATFHQNSPDLSHKKLHWKSLNVCDEASVKDLAYELRDRPLDMLINATGILHSNNNTPEKTIQNFNCAFFEKNIAINVTGNILLAKYFQPLLKSDKKTFFIAFSARVGSISDNRLGGWLSYRTSKTALNMAIKTISIEWKRTVPDCCLIAFHPGTTDTPLSKPFQRHVPEGQLHSADETAQFLITLLQTLSPQDSGKFFSYSGEELPW